MMYILANLWCSLMSWCISDVISVTRRSPHSLMVTSLRRRMTCSHRFLHTSPPPLSSKPPSLPVRGASGWICPKMPRPGPVSPSLHRAEWGCCRSHSPRRRGLEWDFNFIDLHVSFLEVYRCRVENFLFHSWTEKGPDLHIKPEWELLISVIFNPQTILTIIQTCYMLHSLRKFSEK